MQPIPTLKPGDINIIQWHFTIFTQSLSLSTYRPREGQKGLGLHSPQCPQWSTYLEVELEKSLPGHTRQTGSGLSSAWCKWAAKMSRQVSRWAAPGMCALRFPLCFYRWLEKKRKESGSLTQKHANRGKEQKTRELWGLGEWGGCLIEKPPIVITAVIEYLCTVGRQYYIPTTPPPPGTPLFLFSGQGN